MTQYRKEVDLLGERDVPADAYWGIHTLRAVENFNISNVTISDVPEFVRGMVMVKKATALANGELGAIPSDIAKAIVAACDEILTTGKCLDQFPSDVYQGGAGTSVNMNTNEVVANLALEKIGHKKGEYDVINPMDHVNASQSTNDAYPTGFRIAVYNSILKLIDKIQYLHDGFDNKAKEFAKILKMGRTQLQDAVPMTVGQEFKAFAVLLEEEVRNLKRTAELLLEVNLGATAIGTGLNTPQGYTELVVKHLAEVTGLPCVPAENLIEATSDCGAYVMVHGALKRTAVKLSKVCNDLRDKCVDGITVNKEICENYVFNSIGIVTYLNPFIGHHNGDLVGKICAQTGKGVREVVLEKGLLTAEQLDDILSVENLMNPTYKAKLNK